ncbi:MAG: hypothetical protein C4540_04690 [Candidatus Omnitrophota bacterium]|jgi:hypothetical protein|nr:MAG: hypothetical protein C4540_04690 [Candidatus Omnitrophota bacterium]
MRLVLKTKEGKIYRLTDPEAAVTPDEWCRVMNLTEWLRDLSNSEKVDFTELMLCVNEQL